MGCWFVWLGRRIHEQTVELYSMGPTSEPEGQHTLDTNTP